MNWDMNKEEFFIMMHEFENANDENKALLDSLRKFLSENHSQSEKLAAARRRSGKDTAYDNDLKRRIDNAG